MDFLKEEPEELDFEDDLLEDEDLNLSNEDEDALLDFDEGGEGERDGDGDGDFGGDNEATMTDRYLPNPKATVQLGPNGKKEERAAAVAGGADNPFEMIEEYDGEDVDKSNADGDDEADEDEDEEEFSVNKMSASDLQRITRTVVNCGTTNGIRAEIDVTPGPSVSPPQVRVGATAKGISRKIGSVWGRIAEKGDLDVDEDMEQEAPKRSRTDNNATGFKLNRRMIPTSTRPTTDPRLRRQTAAAAATGGAETNPFMEHDNDPDPTDIRSYPPELVDLAAQEDDETDDDEDAVMIIGDNRNNIGLNGVVPKNLFGFTKDFAFADPPPKVSPENVGYVSRNRTDRNPLGLGNDSDEAEEDDLMNGIFGKAGIRRNWQRESNVLRRTEDNGIKARKASHKPCTLQQKLFAFNNRLTQDENHGFGNGKKLGDMMDAMSNGIYTSLTIPTSLRKYWNQRYTLFSRFDQGIRLDEESWYSVTPEQIAIHIAQRCQTEGTIIDAFCGCGGNTIQFAKYCKKVVAIDIDPKKIEMAMHNAKIYGVDHKIDFIVADFMAIAPVLKADILFLSPPWGGPGYAKAAEFDLKTMIPMDGMKLFHIGQQITQNIAYFVPRNTNYDQLLELAVATNVGIDVEENFVNRQDKVKTVTVYYGELADKSRVMVNAATGVSGTSRRVPGGPTQLRHKKEGSPELTTMIF